VQADLAAQSGARPPLLRVPIGHVLLNPRWQELDQLTDNLGFPCGPSHLMAFISFRCEVSFFRSTTLTTNASSVIAHV
jgi:hypothetical protein